MNKFYVGMNYLYLMAMLSIVSAGIGASNFSFLIKILCEVLLVVGLITCNSLYMSKRPKNSFIYWTLLIPGMILFNIWFYLVYSIGVGLLSDWITKDGVFKK